ncbi:MopE-related protein [Polyangium sp. y55x31]|uniref:MopE-related protein n=1 Tax=Polyangium sp. y55x31 TaxID=3042688 RepID=UPI00248278C3|nr:MopE-related protein [Polyangium sp. y55x31]MDI1476822.1 MopE-related protein [Polyangium sp. y55x31]
MRRALVLGLVLMGVGAGAVGCNAALGVDDPVLVQTGPGGTGSGGQGGAGGQGGTGGAECTAVETACDGLDDDCNGTIDDLPLASCGDGVCRVTVEACVDGTTVPCVPGLPSQDELCDDDNDGIDDNCNGQVDEGCPCKVGETQACYTGSADTRNIGACKDGSQTCIAENTWGPCEGDTLPSIETCNAVDDDCDNVVDDGFPEIVCGEGACQVTVSSCNPAGGDPPECTPKDPVEEICNGQDDDCNGIVDNGDPGGGGACVSGSPGQCAMGTYHCDGGALNCIPDAKPTMETCNNVDDDCDNATDEGDPGGGFDCPTAQLGECAFGKTKCFMGALICAAPLPVDEICDGKDNDCDGEIDTHGVDADKPCTTDMPGECAPGKTLCVMGELQCKPSMLPQMEYCDGKDNDCDGMTDEGNPNGGAACTLSFNKGVCAAGTETCVGGIVTCVQNVQPSAEICDGLDNDCDGDVDESLACGSCGSTTIASGSCTSFAIPAQNPLTTNCEQIFPPTSTIPVSIAETAVKYYVNAAGGNDNNDGKSPAKAWATLCKAVAMAPAGATILVAQGGYASTSVIVAKELTIKGGFSSSFANWNPDTYPTAFYGQLTLDHNKAVWGGFRMLASPTTSLTQHNLRAGTFVRNYVETLFSGGATTSAALGATACPGSTSTLFGNDVYARSTTSTTHAAIQFGNQRGATILDSNRVCVEGKSSGATTYAINGSGPNTASVASLIARNNVLEAASNNAYLVNFLGSNGGVDFNLIFTNNTMFARTYGVWGTAASSGKMRWRLTNNILFSITGGSTAVNLGAGAGVSLDSAEGNLVFGFNNNLFSTPVPLASSANDTTNTPTVTSVFINATGGDLRLKTGGQGDGTGKNVYNQATYGTVTTDILQSARPQAGVWDRGAYMN